MPPAYQQIIQKELLSTAYLNAKHLADDNALGCFRDPLCCHHTCDVGKKTKPLLTIVNAVCVCVCVCVLLFTGQSSGESSRRDAVNRTTNWQKEMLPAQAGLRICS